MDIAPEDLVHGERRRGGSSHSGGEVSLGRGQVGMAQGGLGSRCVARSLGGPGGMAVAEISEADSREADQLRCMDEGLGVDPREERLLLAPLPPRQLAELQRPGREPHDALTPGLRRLGWDPKERCHAGALRRSFHPAPPESAHLLGSEAGAEHELGLGTGSLRPGLVVERVKPGAELLLVVEVPALVASGWIAAHHRELRELLEPATPARDMHAAAQGLELLADALPTSSRSSSVGDVGLEAVVGDEAFALAALPTETATKCPVGVYVAGPSCDFDNVAGLAGQGTLYEGRPIAAPDPDAMTAMSTTLIHA